MKRINKPPFPLTDWWMRNVHLSLRLSRAWLMGRSTVLWGRVSHTLMVTQETSSSASKLSHIPGKQHIYQAYDTVKSNWLFFGISCCCWLEFFFPHFVADCTFFPFLPFCRLPFFPFCLRLFSFFFHFIADWTLFSFFPHFVEYDFFSFFPFCCRMELFSLFPFFHFVTWLISNFLFVPLPHCHMWVSNYLYVEYHVVQ